MVHSLSRIAFAVLLSVPGLVLVANPERLRLGPDGVLLGILLAYAAPIGWLLFRPSMTDPQRGARGRSRALLPFVLPRRQVAA